MSEQFPPDLSSKTHSSKTSAQQHDSLLLISTDSTEVAQSHQPIGSEPSDDRLRAIRRPAQSHQTIGSEPSDDRLRAIRRSVSPSVFTTTIHVFVCFQLDYCNSLLMCLQ